MNNESNWTGRVHRSLRSAFGPYTSNVIHTEPQRSVLGVVGYAALCIVLALAVAVIWFR